MPSNWLYMDTNFPTFTGKESTGEKISTIQNYLFMLVEQMRYTLQNLDLNNMNDAAVEQFVGTITKPIYAFLEDEVGNIMQLEATAEGLSAAIASAQDDITQLELEAEGIWAAISDAEGNITQLQATSEGLSAAVTNAQDDITQMELEADGIWAAVSDLETATATMLKIDSNGVYITDADGNVVMIHGGQIDADTVRVNSLYGSTVYLKNSDGGVVGTLGITGATTTTYAVDLYCYGSLRMSVDYGTVLMQNNLFGESANYVALDGQNIAVRGYTDGAMYPAVTAIDLGSPSRGMWNAVYSYTGTIQTSDRNLKNSIEDLPKKYVDMVLWLTPKRFKMNNGTSGRYHPGFVAQDVKEGMDRFNVDPLEFAGWCKDTDKDGNDIYMLRYEEFIAILLAAIQNHEKRLKGLEGAV